MHKLFIAFMITGTTVLIVPSHNTQPQAPSLRNLPTTIPLCGMRFACSKAERVAQGNDQMKRGLKNTRRTASAPSRRSYTVQDYLQSSMRIQQITLWTMLEHVHMQQK